MDMNMFAMVSAFTFILVAVSLSLKEGLALEKEILVAALRAFGQLMFIGYILQFIFDMESPFYIILMLAIMILVAGHNAAKRGQGISGVFYIVTGSILAVEVIMILLLLLLQIADFTPQQIIPISGMIVGNAMVAAGLVLVRLQDELRDKREEIVQTLALGASARQAGKPILKKVIKNGMLPSIDAMKTIGLVQLPGMMTGAILAGANPVEAVQLQILIVFILMATVSITTLSIGTLAYRRFFNSNHQLIDNRHYPRQRPNERDSRRFNNSRHPV
jgi:putative ABC transport system permease protein